MRPWKLQLLARLTVALVVVALVGVAPVALADELHFSAPIDLSLSMTGAGAWVTSEGLRYDLVAARCRWCDRDATGKDTLNRVDRSARRALRWRRRRLADAISNMTAFVATPLASAGFLGLASTHDTRSTNVGPDLAIVAESGILAADLNQLVKFVAVRERPDAHARSLADPGKPRTSVDDDLSFYSGHTTEAVSLAVAAGTVASVRGYRLAPVVWGASLPLALVTGYLRIGADRHYLSDVVVGALAGAAVGFLVPYAFHRNEGPSATASSGTGSASASTGQVQVLSFSGVW